jgi:hypothetical protein
MSTRDALVILAGLAFLGLFPLLWLLLGKALERCSHGGLAGERRLLRRGYVERRLDRRASPAPLWPHKERRGGRDRRRTLP